MNKLMVLSLAAIFAAPLAQAEVSITGSVRTALEYVSPDSTGVKAGSKSDGENKLLLNDQSSRIRFSGVDKLDFGGDLVWVLESRFRVGDPYNKEGTAFGSRDTYIGYKGDFGFARFGKMDNAYKNIYKNIAPALEGSMNDSSSYMGSSSMLRRLGDRQGSVIFYETPSLGGFGAQASYTIGEKTDKVDPSDYNIGAFYKDKMFNVGASYSLKDDQNSDYKSSKISSKATSGASISGYMVGANVNYADFGLGATWERVTRDDGKMSRDQDTYAVAATYKVDKFSFQAAYLNVNDVDSYADSGADQYTLAAAYSLSKRTRLIGSYSQVNNDKNSTFTTESGYSVNAGQDVGFFAVGVRSDF
ncbi:porin [Chitinibacter sp. SCUT-21]|uniref:porin n=1 Tax=Chitinibacter sp. SCUT-21 TaxID=2970891 RepID=UPI0035A6447D